MRYNFIGDIHGRMSWQRLVKDDCINIFIGDYFSPYSKKSFSDLRMNFLDIIDYKDKHPETVLLIGNHDEDHWHIREGYSRHDFDNEESIANLFESNKEYINGAAYAIENKVLATHAGVSYIWYLRYKYGYNLAYVIDMLDDHESKTIDEVLNKIIETELMGIKHDSIMRPGRSILWNNQIYLCDGEKFEAFSVTPDDLAKFVNDAWWDKKYYMFNFHNNAGPYDCYGDDEKHGPMWIRPSALQYANIFKFTNYAQVAGHSMYDHPMTYRQMALRNVENDSRLSNEEDKIFFVDCLQYNVESLIYDSETELFYINK